MKRYENEKNLGHEKVLTSVENTLFERDTVQNLYIP